MATAEHNLSCYDRERIPSAAPYKFGIIVSEWNCEITEALFRGAHDTLTRNGADPANIIRWDAPGSFELVYEAAAMSKDKSIDAIIVLGSIIRGETPHFDFISQATFAGISQLNAKGEIPVILGVLTDNNKQQAMDRSGGKHGNKGVECAVAAIKLAVLSHGTRDTLI